MPALPSWMPADVGNDAPIIEGEAEELEEEPEDALIQSDDELER